MEILFIIIAIVVCIISVIIAYKAGTQVPVKAVEINNEQLKNERQQLLQENERIKKDIQDHQQTIQESNEIVKKAADLQRTMMKDAEDAQAEKLKVLEADYNKQMRLLKTQYQDLENTLSQKYNQDKQNFEQELINQRHKMYNDFEEKKLAIKLETEQLEKELTKMRKARKATIEANKRAAAVQENKEKYSLQINAADANDIRTMESIRHLLSKPRILSMLIWQTYYQPLAKKLFPTLLGQDKKCGIYKITNTVTEEPYIGQSTDCRNRWNQHCKCGLGIDTPANNKLYKSMQQYGLENFTFELLEECDSSELNEREKYYIDMFNSVDFGLNGTVGNE